MRTDHNDRALGVSKMRMDAFDSVGAQVAGRGHEGRRRWHGRGLYLLVEQIKLLLLPDFCNKSINQLPQVVVGKL